MKIKKKNKKNFQDVKNAIEDFLHSDSVPANATKLLLMVLALGSVVVGGAVLPGVLKALKKIDLSEKKTGFTEKKIKEALGSLKRRKLIEIEKYDGEKVFVKLTNKGREMTKEFYFDLLKIERPKKWDGKWRIVIFDIPNRFKPGREALRGKIKELGLHQLQKSVWVYPYECEDEILFVAEAFEVQRYVEIITADKLLHEKIIKNKFRDLLQ
jgi:DNA-binding transcriptional regulator PaaX